jgi:cyanobactin biosynthesis protein (PatB/AcyB/McaB family)
MTLPILAKPVTRPHFVDPSTCIDLEHGEKNDIRLAWLELVFGANYNDPASFRYPTYRQVMSSTIVRWRS